VHQRLLLYDKANHNSNRLANIEKPPKKTKQALRVAAFATGGLLNLYQQIPGEKKPAAAGFF
jgi:hypothetical protein